MATTVGMESNVQDLLADLIQLDFDAADAYEAAIDRVQDPSYRLALGEFRIDHLRHIDELSDLLRAMDADPPEQGSLKSLLTRGKVAIGGLIGDKAILEAMRSNEADTNTAYERAVGHPDLAPAALTLLERGLADERRHCEWVLSALNRLS